MKPTSRRLCAAVALAVAVLVALAGCGGTSPANGAATTAAPSGSAVVDPHTSWDSTALPDPCRTLQSGEIATVVGGSVSAGVRLESWPPLCQFVLDPQRREFLYTSDDAGTTGRQDFDRKRADSAATQVVEGIGDQAYWQPDFTSLHVMSGATHVYVAFAGPVPPNGAKDKAVALARLMLTRAKA